jgi:HK97 family phage major capsid protein
LPETVIDRVFEDIRAGHPLLEKVAFTQSGALVKWLLSETSGLAAWGTLMASITAEISASFSELDLTLAKLSAFVPVSNAYLDLGPEWLFQLIVNSRNAPIIHY